MKQVYLAGPPSKPLGEDGAFEWHKRAKQYLTYQVQSRDHVRVINPYKMTDGGEPMMDTIERGLNFAEQSDVVIARETDGFNQPGAAMEVRAAWEQVIPVILWADMDGSPSSALECHAEEVVDVLADAAEIALWEAL